MAAARGRGRGKARGRGRGKGKGSASDVSSERDSASVMSDQTSDVDAEASGFEQASTKPNLETVTEVVVESEEIVSPVGKRSKRGRPAATKESEENKTPKKKGKGRSNINKEVTAEVVNSGLTDKEHNDDSDLDHTPKKRGKGIRRATRASNKTEIEAPEELAEKAVELEEQITPKKSKDADKKSASKKGGKVSSKAVDPVEEAISETITEKATPKKGRGKKATETKKPKNKGAKSISEEPLLETETIKHKEAEGGSKTEDLSEPISNQTVLKTTAKPSVKQIIQQESLTEVKVTETIKVSSLGVSGDLSELEAIGNQFLPQSSMLDLERATDPNMDISESLQTSTLVLNKKSINTGSVDTSTQSETKESTHQSQKNSAHLHSRNTKLKRNNKTTALPKHADGVEVVNPYLEVGADQDIQNLAKSTWTKPRSAPKFQPKTVDNLFFKSVAGRGEIDWRKVATLELEGCLEKFLWPNFDPIRSLPSHIMLIILIISQKLQDTTALSPWETLSDDSYKYQEFVRKVMKLKLASVGGFKKEQAFFETLPVMVQNQCNTSLLRFFTATFHALDHPVIREMALKLTTISIWNHLATVDRRNTEFAKLPQLKKVWKQAEKKFSQANEPDQLSLTLQSQFLSDLFKHILTQIYSIKVPEEVDGGAEDEEREELILYGERGLELIIDLISQLPTRRFVNTLVDDHHFVLLVKGAPILRDVKLGQRLAQLLDNLEFYAHFQIDDFTGQALTEDLVTERLYQDVNQLMLLAFRSFPTALENLATSNVGKLINRDNLMFHLNQLSHDQVMELCHLLSIRTVPIVQVGDEEANGVYGKRFLLECLAQRFVKRLSHLDEINRRSLYPTESDLFDNATISNQFYNGEYPLALPKLNLQFLTLHDYLLRNFHLFRLESYYEIRQDIEDSINRVLPRYIPSEKLTAFAGWSRMCTEVKQVRLVELKKPRLGETVPHKVVADLQIDLSRYTESIQNEWKGLRAHDILFLITVQANKESSKPHIEGTSFQDHFGITCVRGCEVVDVLGDDGKFIDEVGKPRVENRLELMKSPLRTVRVNLDPNQYQKDTRNESSSTPGIYETFNLVLRRKPKENNFKPVLETIRDLMQSELIVPDWLKNVILGYGDPNSAHYSKLLNSGGEVKFHDTFLDLGHIKETFPNAEINAPQGEELDIPPFKLLLGEDQGPPAKKRKGSDDEVSQKFIEQKQLALSSYTVPSMGPYPSDQPHRNTVRFTPQQVEAIYSGMNPGLSLIVGPPGTGKTDVAVQIISNLYHSYPDQKILLVTHSNQALNQLFEKIMALDIDPRHLLRLGHGEEELDTDSSFSKYGRVTSFLEQRLQLLEQADKLVKSLKVEGDHAHSCEAALQFFDQYVQPKWKEFLRAVTSAQPSDQNIKINELFPFHQFFADAPQPLFKNDSDDLERALACYRHLQNVVSQLESIRPFELLRTRKDRADYLLIKEARIVAMTCTHAALKRREFAELGFKYDNVVLEEAGQILEVETFIPLVLQDPGHDSSSRLKRVVLIGDHRQLPPVVKNRGFQLYGNMEQSLFHRLIRLNVPHVMLDRQGRARPQIADLYRYRYPQLQDLHAVSQGQFQLANAGFDSLAQFIDLGHTSSESAPVPYFYQNLVEAEYVVALYQFMRLIGYPASKISILTTYNGQVALLKDILKVRCQNHRLFGMPAKVSTVDKYQGEQNDYILLSLVRTKSIGHLRDIRRLTVALSRARLGLYTVGSKELFFNTVELQPALNQFYNAGQSNKFIISPTESYPTSRAWNAKLPEGMTIESVGALGELVVDMANQAELEIQRAVEGMME